MDDVHQFYVVRSVSEKDPGLVIGDALSFNARTLEDTFVKVGQRYWYRMVAIDKAGNRSDLSNMREINVMNPPVPAPKKPSAKFIEEPLRYVEISFDQPQKKFDVEIQYKEGDKETWLLLLKFAPDSTKAVDIKIHPKGRV